MFGLFCKYKSSFSYSVHQKKGARPSQKKKKTMKERENNTTAGGGGVGEIKCNHYLHKATEVGFPWALFQLCLSPPFLFPFLFKDLKKKQCKMKS